MNKIKFKNLCIATSISIICLLLYNISAFSYSCQTIRDDVIRLHILANSDSHEDQQLKLKVRDAILTECPDVFKNINSTEEAKDIIESKTDKLSEIADKTIKENGYSYNVETHLVNEYFTTRVYDDVTLPAGKYLALKIIIGNGEGKNWWCVMFPSVCLPAVECNSIDTVFNNNQKDIVINTSKYEVRFRFLEYIEKLKVAINNE